MEFATEMVIKAACVGGRIAEVPITLHPDGRKAHAPHLKTFRDGWRTLRFLLLYSPRWLFLIPGLALVALGLLAFALALPGVQIGPARLDAHTLLFASLGLIVGFQAVLFVLATKAFAIGEGLLPPDPRLRRFLDLAQLEKGLLAGVVGVRAGGGAAPRGGERVAPRRLRRPRLRAHHARASSPGRPSWPSACRCPSRAFW